MNDSEVDQILRDNNVEPMKRAGGPVDLKKYGLDDTKRYSLQDSPEYAEFMRQFNEQFGNGSAEDAIQTVQQLQRAKARAEQRAEELTQKLDLSKWEAKLEKLKAVEQEQQRGQEALKKQKTVFLTKAATQQRKENMRAALDLADARREKLAALDLAASQQKIAVYDSKAERDARWTERVAQLKEDARARLQRSKRTESHTFLKIPKNREWGAILGTPFSRMLQGLDGREDPFENYLETSLLPNFIPSGPLDAIGISQAVDLATNKDFAGRAIIPYAYQSASPSEQYDSDTSMLAIGTSKVLDATVGNLVAALGGEMEFSPMQIDYIIHDYCGDFVSMFADAFPQGLTDGSTTPRELGADLKSALGSSIFTDNRYSNQQVSDYYDAMDSLDRAVADMTVRGEDYKSSTEYKLRSALNSGLGKEISALNTQVRNLPDGAEKDAVKAQIATLAQEALDFYEKSMSGQIEDPQLYQTYSDYSSALRSELMSLDDYSKDYGFAPSTYKPTAITYPEGSNREYVLTEADRAQYGTLYRENYEEIMSKLISTTRYQKAKPERRAELLEAARDDVLEATKKDMVKQLKASGVKTTRKS